MGLVCDSDESQQWVQWCDDKNNLNKEVSINMLPCCLINEEVFSYMPRKRLGLKKKKLESFVSSVEHAGDVESEKKPPENWITFLLG